MIVKRSGVPYEHCRANFSENAISRLQPHDDSRRYGIAHGLQPDDDKSFGLNVVFEYEMLLTVQRVANDASTLGESLNALAHGCFHIFGEMETYVK